MGRIAAQAKGQTGSVWCPLGELCDGGAFVSGLKSEDPVKVCKDRSGGSQAFQYLGVLHHPLVNCMHLCCFVSFSPTCHLDDGDEVACDQCDPGYTGVWCERYSFTQPVSENIDSEFCVCF